MSRITSTTQLAITAVFTSLVCVATMIFSVYVPHTKGFFNIGETMVYITALLFGPLVGSFAGGVGSMAADIFLGYSHYAPATLVIKACEGGIVGVLSRKKLGFGSRLRWKAFTFVVGLIAGVLLGGIGSLYYSSAVKLYLGIPPPEDPNLILFVPPEFWYSLGALVVFLVTLMGFIFEPEFGWLILTTLIGGLEMVIGYFIYQQFFLWPLFGVQVIAIA
ncbi:ECF transporter S component, partial [Candidatus Bathyarchaeota archaeon]|nr:ECF transporter S component [Candidatus Bathyarchaeota archaeon]